MAGFEQMGQLTKSDRIKVSLLALLTKEDRITPTKIASLLQCKYESASNALVFLDRLGLVEKETISHGTKDYTYYHLTKIGRRVAENAGTH